MNPAEVFNNRILALKKELESHFKNNPSQVLKISSKDAMSITGCRKPDSLKSITEKMELYFNFVFYYKTYDCFYFVALLTEEDKPIRSKGLDIIEFFVYRYVANMAQESKCVDSQTISNFLCFKSTSEFMEVANSLQRKGLIRIESSETGIQLSPSIKKPQIEATELPASEIARLNSKIDSIGRAYNDALNLIIDEIEMLTGELVSQADEINALKNTVRKIEEDGKSITEKYFELKAEIDALKIPTGTALERLSKLNSRHEDTIITESKKQGGIKHDQNKLEQLRKIVKLN
ncbi:MAG TPA: hypothetical protein P5539_10805 [Mesotoga sp.]|nr:hypothetical protein [Mesotoga sp.]